MRADSSYLSKDFMPFAGDNTSADLYSITDFLQYSPKKVYDSGEYLSSADQKFILAKVMNYYFIDNHAMLCLGCVCQFVKYNIIIINNYT